MKATLYDIFENYSNSTYLYIYKNHKLIYEGDLNKAKDTSFLEGNMKVKYEALPLQQLAIKIEGDN